MVNLSALPLFVLPLVILIVGINIYFRLRIMRGFRDLHKKGVQLNPADVLSAEAREVLVTQKYPQHKEEIKQLSRHLGLSLKMIVVTVIVMLGIFLFTYFNHS